MCFRKYPPVNEDRSESSLNILFLRDQQILLCNTNIIFGDQNRCYLDTECSLFVIKTIEIDLLKSQALMFCHD